MRTRFKYKYYHTLNMYHVYEDGKDVGRFALQLRPDHVHIYSVLIQEPYRRQGLGTKLMKKALRIASKYRGLVALDVRPQNTVAIHMYEKLGFKMVQEGYMEATCW